MRRDSRPLVPTGTSPLEVPRYSVADVARFLHIPAGTVRSWVLGRPYEKAGKQVMSPPVIRPVGGTPVWLSFNNLIEAHVLHALRHLAESPVQLRDLRSAIQFAEESLNIERLLLSNELLTGAGDLFIERYGQLIKLNASGQVAMKRLLRDHLERVVRDGILPVRLHPFVASGREDHRPIIIDPKISFGRPVVAERFIATAVIAARLNAGESIEYLAADYRLSGELIESAAVYEQRAA